MRRIALTPLIGALAAGLLALAAPAVAATGLDPTYGDGGVATMREHRPESGELLPLPSFFGAIDPLGRVMRISLETDQVVRLGANGQPDASFGDEGEAELPDGFDPFVVDATETSLVVGGDVAGDLAVAKLTDEGGLDDEFGDGGIALLGGAELGQFVADVDLAQSGAVTATVSGSNSPQVSVVRLLPDGQLDAGFGEAGTISRTGEGMSALAFEGLDADERGVVFLRNFFDSSDPSADGVFLVERVGVDGEPDPSFGIDGEVLLPGGALAVDIDERDGSIFVGGAAAGDGRVWHLRADGRVAGGFSGAAGAAVPGSRLVLDLVALDDGRVAAIGQSISGSDSGLAAVLRPDGTADAGFGADGVEPVPENVPLAGGIGTDGNGRVLVYTRDIANGASGLERARAYTTDFADLAPAITEVAAYESSLSVEWAAPEAPSEHPVRIWHLMATDVEGDLVGQSVVAGDVRQASIEGLDPLHEDYDIVVLPYDDFGPGVASEPFAFSSVEVAPAAQPAPAVGDLAVSAGKGFAAVSWTPPEHDGGTTIWGYSVVVVDKTNGALAGWRNVRADVRTAAMPGLTDGTVYDVYVIPITTVGFGTAAGPLVVTPSASGPVSATPEMSWVSVVPVGSHAVVTWGPPTERGEAASGVHVVVIEDGAMTHWKALTAFERQIVVPAAPGAQVYVFAQSAGGFGPLAGPITVGP